MSESPQKNLKRKQNSCIDVGGKNPKLMFPEKSDEFTMYKFADIAKILRRYLICKLNNF